VAVGNNLGLEREEPLQFAQKDAKSLVDVFVSMGDVARNNAFLLADKTLSQFETVIKKIKDKVAFYHPEVVTFIFYYSGHGDEASLHFGPQKLGHARLIKMLDGISAGLKIMLIDACRTQAQKGFHYVPRISLQLTPQGPKGRIEIRSSSPGEPSQESTELGGGVFTHYFLTALRGAADKNGDGMITLEEAYPFAYERTLRRTAAHAAESLQHPYVKWNFQGKGSWVLTRAEKAQSTLVFPKGPGIQYLVYRLPSAAVVAEVRGEKNETVRLALPSGRYLVQRRAPGKYGAMEVMLGLGRHHVLSRWDFRPLPLRLLALKGGHLLVYR
jgi:hypothetical protein